jgi:hypothetical protein
MSTVKRNNADISPEKGLIIQNITIRPVVRQSQDIERWRNAIRAAEALNPIRYTLYDLYEEIMLDGVLTNLVEKRVLGVTKKKLLFVDKSGKEVQAMTDLLNKKQFRKLRKEIQLQKVYGISVIELINDASGFRIFSVPRKHIQPKTGMIVYEQTGTDGINYKQPPASNYILEVGDWSDFGLLMKAAQYVIYKRGGFGDWSNFAMLFGMPFREARYDGFNDATRKQLEMALEQAGSAAYAILPKDAEFKLHEASNTQGGGEMYNSLRKACNEELAILFLGQTETTSKTAGKLGGNDDTHEQTENDINANDRADELSIMNEQVVPILKNLGFPADGFFVYEEQEEDIPLDIKIDNVIKLRQQAGLPIDDDYIYEMSGIPKPANYDAIKKEQADQATRDKAAFEKDAKKPKKKDKPTDKEEEQLSWKDKLLLKMADFFDQARQS